MKNKRKRGFVVLHTDTSSFSKDGKCVTSFLTAIFLYKKYCKLYPNELISIHEIRVLTDITKEVNNE